MSFSADQDLADTIVAREIAGYPRQRALARALFRAAVSTIALLEGDQATAEVLFRRWRKHEERASQAPRMSGSRR